MDEWTSIEIVERTVASGGNQGDATLVFHLSGAPDHSWQAAFSSYNWKTSGGGLSPSVQPTIRPSVYQNRVVWEVPDAMIEEAARQVQEAVKVANADYERQANGPPLESEEQAERSEELRRERQERLDLSD